MKHAPTWALLFAVMILLCGCSTVAGAKKDIDSVLGPVLGSDAGKAAVETGITLLDGLLGGGLLTSVLVALGFRRKAKKEEAKNEAIIAISEAKTKAQAESAV